MLGSDAPTPLPFLPFLLDPYHRRVGEMTLYSLGNSPTFCSPAGKAPHGTTTRMNPVSQSVTQWRLTPSFNALNSRAQKSCDKIVLGFLEIKRDFKRDFKAEQYCSAGIAQRRSPTRSTAGIDADWQYVSCGEHRTPVSWKTAGGPVLVQVAYRGGN